MCFTGSALPADTPLASREGRQNRDGVAFLEWRLELPQVSDVFVVQVDVDETVQRPVLHDLLFEAWIASVEIRDELSDVRALALDRLCAGDLLQDCGDCHFDHRANPLADGC